MFANAVESMLQDHCTLAVVRAAEAGQPPQLLRDVILSSGFLDLLADEDDGGGGLTLREFYPVAALCGAYAAPLPIAQTMAARLLVTPRAALPDGFLTFAPASSPAPDGAGVCALVPYAMVADHVLLERDGVLCVLAVADAKREATGVHAALGATLYWRVSDEQRLPSQLAHALHPLAALLHAAMMAGAMKKAFDLTLQFGNSRVQFGKSIGKFQAVQHQLSVMAEHVCAAGMAAEAGFQCGRHVPSLLACAVAKSRTSEAAQVIASIAHAVHGAMGVTAEYELQIYTRRLHEWRMAHGSENHWNRVLGQSLLDSHEPLITDFVRHITA
jgi:acyl-CoA dehydrogenase